MQGETNSNQILSLSNNKQIVLAKCRAPKPCNPVLGREDDHLTIFIMWLITSCDNLKLHLPDLDNGIWTILLKPHLWKYSLKNMAFAVTFICFNWSRKRNWCMEPCQNIYPRSAARLGSAARNSKHFSLEFSNFYIGNTRMPLLSTVALFLSTILWPRNGHRYNLIFVGM